MKKEQKPLSRLSHRVLFRVIVNRLWGAFDSGGISVGRSYQASLLEGFMDLFPLHEPYYGIRGNMHKEARDRVNRFLYAQQNIQHNCRAQHTQLELPFTGLEVLSNVEFALLSLEEMCRWYEEEAKGLGFHNQSHVITTNILRELFELCYAKEIRRRPTLNLIDGQITKESIIKEGEWRNRHRITEGSRMEDFQRFGISPWKDQLHNQ